MKNAEYLALKKMGFCDPAISAALVLKSAIASADATDDGDSSLEKVCYKIWDKKSRSNVRIKCPEMWYACHSIIGFSLSTFPHVHALTMKDDIIGWFDTVKRYYDVYPKAATAFIFGLIYLAEISYGLVDVQYLVDMANFAMEKED